MEFAIIHDIMANVAIHSVIGNHVNKINRYVPATKNPWHAMNFENLPPLTLDPINIRILNDIR